MQTIVYSIIGDPTAAVQAMENEEIDLIQPQATADILTQLEGIADRGVEVIQDDAAPFEHVDLASTTVARSTRRPTAATRRRPWPCARRSSRRASPGHRRPADHPAQRERRLRNSFTEVPGTPSTTQLVAENGSDEYAETDIELSQQILADAGVDTTTPIEVRFSFDDTTRGGPVEYELIRDSVAQAGFDVVNANRPDWGQQLAEHVDLRRGPVRLAVDGGRRGRPDANYVTDGGMNNFYGYNNPE